MSDLRDDIDGASQFLTKSGTDALKGVFVSDDGARKIVLESYGRGEKTAETDVIEIK